MLLRDKENNTVKQAGKQRYDWSCEKNPVTKVTGRGILS